LSRAALFDALASSFYFLSAWTSSEVRRGAGITMAAGWASRFPRRAIPFLSWRGVAEAGARVSAVGIVGVAGVFFCEGFTVGASPLLRRVMGLGGMFG